MRRNRMEWMESKPTHPLTLAQARIAIHTLTLFLLTLLLTHTLTLILHEHTLSLFPWLTHQLQETSPSRLCSRLLALTLSVS